MMTVEGDEARAACSREIAKAVERCVDALSDAGADRRDALESAVREAQATAAQLGGGLHAMLHALCESGEIVVRCRECGGETRPVTLSSRPVRLQCSVCSPLSTPHQRAKMVLERKACGPPPVRECAVRGARRLPDGRWEFEVDFPPDIGALPERLDRRRVYRFRQYVVVPMSCGSDEPCGGATHAGTLTDAIEIADEEVGAGRCDYAVVGYHDDEMRWVDGDWQRRCGSGEVCVLGKEPPLRDAAARACNLLHPRDPLERRGETG